MNHEATGERASESPAGPQREATFFPEVESLRGLAILLVLFHHVDGLLTPHLATGGVQVSPLRAFVSGGQTGVSLFFVLSAFCLSMPFFRSPAPLTRASWLRFSQRRALRILPGYWTAIAVGAVVTGCTWADLPNLLGYAIFLESFPGGLAPMKPFSDVWWSLATEVQFYLLLPLLPFALRSATGRRVGKAALVAYAALFALYQFGCFGLQDLDHGYALGLSVLGRGPIFLTGIAAAWWYARHGRSGKERLAKRKPLRNGVGDVVLLGLLAAMGGLLSWQVSLGFWVAEQRGWFLWHIAEAILWSAVLLVLLTFPLRMKALLCNPVLGRIGDWSYSIYLLHLPVIVYAMGALRRRYPMDYLSWNPRSTAVVMVLAAVCIGLSACTYRWIESPFLKRKAKLEA